MTLRWSIVLSDTPSFITSDHPVTVIHPSLSFRGFNDPETIVIFPLSPYRLLVMDHRMNEPAGQYYPAGDALPSWNRSIWRSAIEYMFCSRNPDEVIAELVLDAEIKRLCMKEAFAISLIRGEMALIGKIEFDALKLTGSEHARSNGELALKLVQLFLSRDAIPGHRWDWFVDPEHNVGGRGSSKKDVFERNGTQGDDIARHPHFLPYLHYFIYGPDLPPLVIANFQGEVEKCGSVTSGDVIPLGCFARHQTRTAGLDRRMAADEFFKLALELDLSLSTALSIRRQVMQA